MHMAMPLNLLGMRKDILISRMRCGTAMALKNLNQFHLGMYPVLQLSADSNALT